jgi:hypothetical protein
MRFDPPDDDAYDIKYDGTACDDCGRPSVAWLCDDCSDQREYWAAAAEQRMTTANYMSSTHIPEGKPGPAVVEVALVPVFPNGYNPVVEVALVPVVKQSGQVDEKLLFEHLPIAAADARFLKRMAKAILSADLSNIQEVA